MPSLQIFLLGWMKNNEASNNNPTWNTDSHSHEHMTLNRQPAQHVQYKYVSLSTILRPGFLFFGGVHQVIVLFFSDKIYTL
jgi:hypothetical protein